MYSGSSLDEVVNLINQEGEWAACGNHTVYHILFGGLCWLKLYFFFLIHIFEVILLKVKPWHIPEYFIEVPVSYSPLISRESF